MSASTDPALLSAEDMLTEFARLRLTPVDVLQAVTERVTRLNPSLNAFVVMNPQALAAAGESEARWKPRAKAKCAGASAVPSVCWTACRAR